MKKPSEILDQAMTYIDTPEKWCKGTEYRPGTRDHHPQYCARGAIRRALNQDDQGFLGFYESAISKQFAALRNLEYTSSISAYNDLITTTHEDVIAAMTKARNEFQEQGQ